MITFKTGTESEKARLQKHVKKILEAKRKGEASEIDVYEECMLVERSDLWTITGMTWKQFLRDGVGVDVGKYVSYKTCVELLGHAELNKMGFVAAREVVRLTGSDGAMAKTLGRGAVERVVGFRTERGFPPSPSYTRTIVEEEARRMGIEVTHKPNGTKRAFRKAIMVLQQIARMEGEAAAVLARVCLKDIGYPIEDEIPRAAA